tara:strand:- start:7616 stop:7783 length:168 start_codon:yes stop_codon:yes gene_type:complete
MLLNPMNHCSPSWMMTAASLLRQTNPVAKLTAKYRQKQKLLFLRLSDTTLLAMFF